MSLREIGAKVDFIRANTRLQAPPHVPEISLHLADEAAEPPEGQREGQVGLTSSRNLPLLDHLRGASEQVSLCLPAARSDLSHRKPPALRSS